MNDHVLRMSIIRWLQVYTRLSHVDRHKLMTYFNFTWCGCLACACLGDRGPWFVWFWLYFFPNKETRKQRQIMRAKRKVRKKIFFFGEISLNLCVLWCVWPIWPRVVIRSLFVRSTRSDWLCDMWSVIVCVHVCRRVSGRDHRGEGAEGSQREGRVHEANGWAARGWSPSRRIARTLLRHTIIISSHTRPLPLLLQVWLLKFVFILCRQCCLLYDQVMDPSQFVIIHYNAPLFCYVFQSHTLRTHSELPSHQASK